VVVVKVVLAELSPQATVTVQGTSRLPGSLKEPRAMAALTPSMAVWLAGADPEGGTLLTTTEVLPLPLSPSVTVAWMV
jgi:hypothetical protein